MAEACFYLGGAGQTEPAAGIYRTGLLLDPSHGCGLTDLAAVEVKTGDYQLAFRFQPDEKSRVAKIPVAFCTTARVIMKYLFFTRPAFS